MWIHHGQAGGEAGRQRWPGVLGLLDLSKVSRYSAAHSERANIQWRHERHDWKIKLTIEHEIKDLDVLLAMTPNELAPFLLRDLAQRIRGNSQGNFNTYGILQEWTGMNQGGANRVAYNRVRINEVELALGEALHWLTAQQLVMPDFDQPTGNGWMRLTRRGMEAAASPDAFERFRRAASFPKTLLHPLIADKVWLALARGDLADAVFISFRTVEERVREAGKFTAADYGADMVRKAFHPDNGPLTKATDPKAEREGLMLLASGAIASYKNPHSHRTVTIGETLEAQEMVMLASHLLRIVDSRSAS